MTRYVVRENLHDVYELKGIIGKGGFSTVYLGIDRITKKKRAIKIIKVEKNVKNSSFGTIIKNEVNILQKLQSPNIANLVEVYEEIDQVVIVLKYIEGYTLSEVRSKGIS